MGHLHDNEGVKEEGHVCDRILLLLIINLLLADADWCISSKEEEKEVEWRAGRWT